MQNGIYEIIHRINCLTEDIDSQYHQAAVKLGVSDSVLFVLYMVYTNGEKCLLCDIYKSSGISKQTINSAIRKLEKDQIVYLDKTGGKEKVVCLTEQGKLYAKQTAAKVFEAECNVFGGWNEEEMKQYLSLIEKFDVSLREQIQKL
ncbi:MAG: MarR family transcriptional regulator [Fusicatenibacter sp.]|nr:MarR family transcriptional regulator [Lachnospiraceae bacterium]MDY2937250.1 MarR family transcriptional regulator [Fusicatenibacter sp.]